MCAQQSQKSEITRPGFHLGAPNKRTIMTNQFYIKYIGNPLPESCVGLFITLCTEWILTKHAKNMFLNNKLKNPKVTWPGFHLGAPKNVKL